MIREWHIYLYTPFVEFILLAIKFFEVNDHTFLIQRMLSFTAYGPFLMACHNVIGIKITVNMEHYIEYQKYVIKYSFSNHSDAYTFSLGKRVGLFWFATVLYLFENIFMKL